MTGFEPWISGVGSDHSTNWATTTAQILIYWLTKNIAMKLSECFKVSFISDVLVILSEDESPPRCTFLHLTSFFLMFNAKQRCAQVI